MLGKFNFEVHNRVAISSVLIELVFKFSFFIDRPLNCTIAPYTSERVTFYEVCGFRPILS